MVSEEKSSQRGGKYFKVRVKLPQALKGDLIIGLNKTVYGEIILEEKEGVLNLPFETIRYEEDATPYVFIYRNEKAKKQKINIGIKGEECVEIINGVNGQDKIITRENSPLVDNQKVTLLSKDEF